MADVNECMSDLALDELLAESVESTARARGLLHLESCVRCALRYESLANQRAGFLERAPSWQHLRAQRQAARRGGDARRWLWGGGAMLAAGLLLAVSFAQGFAAPGLRSKGGPHIGAYVKHGERVVRADSGSTVRPGDYVRFTYSSDEPVHFALLNRDALHATAYFPAGAAGAQTERVAAGHDVALDFSIKLDHQLGSEQIHGVFCDRPEPLEPLLSALQATGRLPPLPHCRVDVLTLEKKGE